MVNQGFFETGLNYRFKKMLENYSALHEVHRNQNKTESKPEAFSS